MNASAMMMMNGTNATAGNTVNRHSLHRAIGTMCPSLPDSNNVVKQFFDPVDTSATAYTIYFLALFVPFFLLATKSGIAEIKGWIDKATGRLIKCCCGNPAEKDDPSSGLAEKDDTLPVVREGLKAAAENKAEDLKNTVDEMTSAKLPEKDDMSSVMRIILCWLQVPLLVAGAVHFYISVVPQGGSWQSTALFWAAAPMAKAIAVPMWVILLPVGQFAHWLLHHHKTPIEQTGIPAGTPPLPKNGLTLALMAVTASLFLVWMATALPVILLLFAFPLTTLLQFLW
jgi:hypothetical protein